MASISFGDASWVILSKELTERLAGFQMQEINLQVSRAASPSEEIILLR